MAVKSILPLTCTNELLENAFAFLDSQILDFNSVHGHLLLLSVILEKSEKEEIIINMRQHCDKWQWINMVECDVIQSLYFDLCYRVYFGASKDELHFEARHTLWNLSRQGLMKQIGLSSYGSSTSKTRIYLSGINEFCSEADVSILDLVMHPFYEVQLATFEYLISAVVDEFLNLPAVLEACLCLVRSKETKEEVLRFCSDFLGKHSKSIHSEKYLLSDISLYEENIMANHLIDVYLPCMGSIMAQVCCQTSYNHKLGNIFIEKFMEMLKIHTDEGQPKFIRLSAVKAISNSLLIDSSTDKSVLLPLLFHVNQLMGDEEDDIRLLSGNMMASFLNMVRA